MKKCSWCGKEYADTATLCSIDLRPLYDVAMKGNGEQRQERQRAPDLDSEHREQIPTAAFSCFQCGGNLRVRLPQTDVALRCPKCRTEFSLTKAGDSPLVFIVVPDMSQFTSKASGSSTRRKREDPRDVASALSTFGLEESATFDQVRSAYRELVKGYHPDKVAHLGPDLRRVAEAKTKEINSAYRVLETFYAA